MPPAVVRTRSEYCSELVFIQTALSDDVIYFPGSMFAHTSDLKRLLDRRFLYFLLKL
jgi:hypothetical protein